MPTFQCQNAGCGYSSFSPADEEEEFYRSHRLHWPPLSCPACRAFKKAQVDSEITCQICGGHRIETARRKISYNKHEGKYLPPVVCVACEKDPSRAERYELKKNKRANKNKNRAKEKDLPFTEELSEVENLPIYTDNPVYELPDDYNYYISLPDKSGKTNNRAEHIARHGSDIAEATGQANAQKQIEYFAYLAKSTDSEFRMTLYQKEGNKTIIIDKSKNEPEALMVCIQQTGKGFAVMTSYKVSAKSVSGKIQSKSWQYP
jgi:hypothetical protein